MKRYQPLPSRLIADLWGPGRFSSALRAAAAQGKVRRTGRGLYALVPGAPDPVKTHDPVTTPPRRPNRQHRE
jgi:hypothetical protein